MKTNLFYSMTILLGLCGCAGTPSAEYTRGERPAIEISGFNIK
jgi:hypothetical protein